MLIQQPEESRLSFDYFALYYLNEWIREKGDKQYVDGLSSNNKQDQLDTLHKFASAYGVARNFAGKGAVRFSNVLSELNKVDIQNREIKKLVPDFASSISSNRRNGTRSIPLSAASKFLWLKFYEHEGGIPIFDQYAKEYLQKKCQNTLRNYASYYDCWQSAFSQKQQEIKTACDRLIEVKKYSYANNIDDEELKKLISKDWFHQRVFDKICWHYGARLNKD